MYIIPIALLVVLIMWRRLAATKKPIRGNGFMILLPILYILCGAAWFFNPQVKASAIPIAIAAILGLVMSVPLIVTTNYEIRGDGSVGRRASCFNSGWVSRVL